MFYITTHHSIGITPFMVMYQLYIANDSVATALVNIYLYDII